jgi:hypothetical protein
LALTVCLCAYGGSRKEERWPSLELACMHLDWTLLFRSYLRSLSRALRHSPLQRYNIYNDMVESARLMPFQKRLEREKNTRDGAKTTRGSVPQSDWPSACSRAAILALSTVRTSSMPFSRRPSCARDWRCKHGHGEMPKNVSQHFSPRTMLSHEKPRLPCFLMSPGVTSASRRWR